MKTKIISLILLFLLAISSITIAGADSIGFDSVMHKQKSPVKLIDKITQDQDKTYDSKQYQINLAENVDVGENQNSPDQKQNKVLQKPFNVQISLNLRFLKNAQLLEVV